ncbi:MAG: T9SS type A sorting domain-containing protein [Ignavibacteria bacterium]|nr:T9SS type A sorting domain-containing protein [Ignavibacteria bacterium]
MKNLKVFSILFILVCTSISYSQFTKFVYNQPVIPDVMGYINVLETDGYSTYNAVYNVDSFPLFTGFPKTFSGVGYEGGILCNMDSDNDLEIVRNIGYTIQAWNYDGSNVPGWPVTVPTYQLECAPSYGDVDGDGQEDIVVTNHGLTSGGFIFAYRKNGTMLPGFPVNHGYSSRTPVLANVDNTPALEIIVNKRQSGANQVSIYTGTGAVLSGWPQSINSVPASSSAVGDITGDGQPEIVSESYNSLYAWDRNGNLLTGFPFTMPNSDVNSYSSPVLADVDGDNIREIIFGTHVSGGGGYVYILKNNGTILSGWPKQVNQWIYGPPAVGYINNDNVIDIAVGDQVLSGSPMDQLNAWDKNGNSLPGFPINSLWAINNQVSIGDIDNDNNMELIIDDNTQNSGRGQYHAFNHDGTPLAGWDVNVDGTTMFSMPMLGDLNRDGLMDISGSGGIFINPAYTFVYLWNTGINYNANKIVIPMFQYNSRHNGVYGDNPLVGIQPVSGSIPKKFMLMQNYPNPFNPSTKIRFLIPLNNIGKTKLIVYDINGKFVKEIVNSELTAGEFEVEFNAAGLSSGIYFYELTSGNTKLVNKMILIK